MVVRGGMEAGGRAIGEGSGKSLLLRGRLMRSTTGGERSEDEELRRVRDMMRVESTRRNTTNDDRETTRTT
jgi:hypothetical protein